MTETLTPYPFQEAEKEEVVSQALKAKFTDLISVPLFDQYDRNTILDSLSEYFSFANMYFREEESMREIGSPGANLYYHGRPHAVFSAPYDAVSIFKMILERDDTFSNHLTAEGVFAGITGTMFHDVGYVSGGPVENYAARSSIHVEESKDTFESIVRLLRVPPGLDLERVILLGKIGIHGTYFPFTQERLAELRELLDPLPPGQRKEAQIIRLAVQIADLGGQCARPDYFPQLLKNLRKEMNEAAANLGTTVIGQDQELQPNRERFLNDFVKKNPSKKTVTTTLLAFLGEEKTKPFRDAWQV